MESTKVGYMYGLTTTWTSCRSFAEKQKVGGMPPPSRTHSITLHHLVSVFIIVAQCHLTQAILGYNRQR